MLSLAATVALALIAAQLPEAFTQGLSTVSAWIAATYDRAPALVLGLAVLLALPPLTFLGLLMRRSSPAHSEATQRYRRPGQGKRAKLADMRANAPLWPADAWLEFAGGSRHEIGPGILRLGRDDDNDICLPDKTVHRYHAAVHRTEDAEYLITDLSSAGGNGVLVNGRRTAEAQLKDGDTIDLGQTRIKFVSRPA